MLSRLLALAGRRCFLEEAKLLAAAHITRRHPDGKTRLLDDVSLEVHPGTRLSVTGDSGSGKTLLLRALAMLDRLDGGQVLWKGDTVPRDDVPGFRRQVMYLHQRPALLEETVGAALQRPMQLAAHRRRRFDTNRIAVLLGQLGRDQSFLDKRAGDLSGGETQIVALLRALQLDPTVLLLDEPTAALDRSTATAVEQLLGHWCDESPEGRAIVWVTHDVEQSRRVARQTLLMHAGRMIDAGHPA